MFQWLADLTGVPLPAVTLVGSLFTSYPLAFVHRYVFWGGTPLVQNAFFATTGMALIYGCYGRDVMHSIVCTLTQWAIFKLMGSSKNQVYISFLFQFAYLLGGYYITATEGYDICWTMPGCVMTLRLIGLAYDRHDGNKPVEKRRPDQLERALDSNPSLIETFGYIFNFNGLMIGPQYPLSLHRKLIGGELTDRPGQVPNSVGPGLATGLYGIILLAISQVSSGYFSPSFLEEEAYFDMPFLYRVGYIIPTGVFHMYKYIASWTVIAGATTITGLGYVKDKEGEVRWDSIGNIKYRLYHTASSYGDMIKSFNVNTNDWVARYIFKRCRWMGSRHLSHLTTLMFLAIWHGYHWCYFHMFFYEFILMNSEAALFNVTTKTQWIQNLPEWVRWVCGYVYVTATWSFCIIDFMLVKTTYVRVWQSIYFCHHAFWIGLWAAMTLIGAQMKSAEKVKSS